jgi:hypothetical protein
MTAQYVTRMTKLKSLPPPLSSYAATAIDTGFPIVGIGASVGQTVRASHE